MSSQGTTSGVPVNVTSNNVLYSFIGENLNGQISIIPTYNPAIIPPGPDGKVVTDLLVLAAQDPGSDLAGVVAALAALPNAAAVQAAIAQFNPIVDDALTQLSFAAAQQFQDLWMRQMGNGRCILAANCGDSCAKGVKRTAKEQASCDLKQKNGCFSEMNCENVDNYFEVWGDAFIYLANQDARDGFNGYNAQIYGGMLGFQGPLNQITSVGGAVGFANTGITRKNHSTFQTYDATVYLSVNPTNWYLDAAFSFDWNQYQDYRHIQFPGVDRTGYASYGGQQYTGLLAGGYRYYTEKCVVITPLASLQYSYLHVGGYHETGAGDLSLNVNSQNYNFLESGLGLKIGRTLQTEWGAFLPEVHGIWFYDYFGDSMDLTSTFSGLAAQSGPFPTNGPGNDKNWGDIGAGITFYSCSDLTLELVYNFEFSNTYHANEGLFKITKRF